MKRTSLLPVVLIALASFPLAATAAVTAEEAAQLKSTLTPLGAERAGNKDGSIPAWTGGYTSVPPNYRNGDPRPDFFAGEKPVISIDRRNLETYASRLTDGTRALMKKYPKFRIDVYPTHRTAAAPQWVYDHTFKNATRARLVDRGHGTEGAYGGTPFPIPKDAYEVFQNHRLAWLGTFAEAPVRAWIVDADGTRTLASGGMQSIRSEYHDPEGSLQRFDGYHQHGKFVVTEPGSKAGEGIIAHFGVNSSKRTGLWQYLVGQRRVRKAPSIGYDTPDAVISGVGLADEAFMLFGPVDKHELTLVGKKEIYIPYNNNRAALAKTAQLFTPQTLNPDLVRWELHRVWVVDATLLPGKRHVIEKRRYYIDEDSWQIILFDGWDADGELWHSNFTLTLLAPDIPALLGNVYWGGYDLRSGAYSVNMTSNELPGQYKAVSNLPRSSFSPDELANGVR
jgi:hypothetical protein